MVTLIKMNWQQIKKITFADILSFFESTQAKKERELLEHRINWLKQYINVPDEVIMTFLKTHELYFEWTLRYAACYGKLPDDKTADDIYRMGFSRWRRRQLKGM